MPRGPNPRMLMRMVLLMSATLLLFSMVRGGPSGLRFAVDGRGISFEMTSAMVNIAFDFGQKCSKADSCGALL